MYFVGIDISKSTFNVAVYHDSEISVEGQQVNTPQGAVDLLIALRQLPSFSVDNSVFCLEHTGVYGWHVLNALHAAGAKICLESAQRIKHSLGLQRGKSDQVDARRIAEYAARYTDKLRQWHPERKCIRQLRLLSTVRSRLLKSKRQLEVPLKEAKSFMSTDEYELMLLHSSKTIETLNAQIEQIDAQILQLIDADSTLKPLLLKATSVPGIGVVTAAELIIRTNEFKNITTGKQLACQVGIAPFEHSSGSSLRGRNRVSHKAHKRLKTLLHLGAMAAVRSHGEFKHYYQRKLEEGKNPMLVLNAVRNKMILRVFAIIRNNTTYQKNYHLSLHKP